MVDLKTNTCSCRMWDLLEIPCNYAISAIYANKERPEDYVHVYFLKQRYIDIYKHVITPISSQDEWEKTEGVDIYPLIPRKAIGRRKKKRI